MNTLLILSNFKKSSHIAIIDEINEESKEFFEKLFSYTKDEDRKAFKAYICSQMVEKEYFNEFGEKPDFTELISHNNIKATITYFEDTQNIVFGIYEKNNFLAYDLKEYVLKYSFNDFTDLFTGKVSFQIQEQNNASRSKNNEENSSQIRNNFAGGQSRIQGDRRAREQNSSNEKESWQRGARAERGISTTSKSANEFRGIQREREERKLRDEQRGGLFEEEFSKGFSEESHSTDTTSPKTAQGKSLQRPLSTTEPRNIYELQQREQARARFRARAEALLQSPRIIRVFKTLLREFSLGRNKQTRKEEFGNSTKSNQSFEIRTEARETDGLDRGAGGFESSEYQGNNEFGSEYRGDRRVYQSGTTRGEFLRESSDTKLTSWNHQQSLAKEQGGLSDEFLQNQSGLSVNSPSTEQEKYTHTDANEQGFDTNVAGNSDTSIQSQGQNSFEQDLRSNDIFGANGILQTKGSEQDKNNEEHRSDDKPSNVIENSTIQQNLPTQNADSRENQSMVETERAKGLGDTYTRGRDTRALFEDLRTQSEYDTQEQSLRVFNEYEFVKKLDGKEYKGEIDFNLSKKQRLEANFKALYLVKEIFKRKDRTQRLESLDKEELLEYTKNQAQNAHREDEYFKEFLENKKAKITQEIKEKQYFSLECPYSEEEQSILARYSGFGGLKELFYDESYKEQRKELLNLVGELFFADLKISSSNAYYTPSSIIKAMYQGLDSLGVPRNEKITALEPSCGIGHFITLAPANYEFVAVEKDSLSATIAKLLHPKTIIYNKGYEEIYFKREFDIVLGNPPYENERADNAKELIHNYFVLKSQSLLKDGGLSSFVISAGFMDSKNNLHRQKLMRDNHLISAFRLPNSSFKATHTEVLSDIVFLRKTNDKENFAKNNPQYPDYIITQFKMNNNLFLNSTEKQLNDEQSLKISSYFEHYYQNILGEQSYGSNQFGEIVLKVKEYENTSLIEQITQELIVNRNFKNISFYNLTPAYKEDTLSLAELELDTKTLLYISNLKIGNIFEYNDNFYTKEENLQVKEVFFEDEFDKEKKYLLENKSILEEKKSKLIFKNTLSNEEKEILRKIIAYRDLLNENLILEKDLPNDEISNAKINEQKEILRALRRDILSLSNTKGFNVSRSQSVKNENGIIIRHSLKKLIELEKLENFKIFASEQVQKIAKKNKFEYEYLESDILQKRVLFPLEESQATNAKEALQKTINKVGFIDLETLQNYLLEIPLEQIIKELSEEELIFPDLSEKHQYCLKNEFLGGNIKAKAYHIEQMIKNGANFNVYTAFSKERYLEILKENFPKDIAYEDLECNFGANFIDLKIYEDFIKQSFFNNPLNINVNLYTMNGEYILENFSNINENTSIKESDLNDLAKSLEVKNEKGEIAFSLRSLIEKTINNKSLEVSHQIQMEDGRKRKVVERGPTSTALKNAEYLKELFSTFIFKNKAYRQSIEKQYNAQINVFSNTKFEFENFLQTPLLSKDLVLRTHQKNAVFKGIMNNSLLLDHQVGAGKTYAGIAIIMEQIRMKLIKKALVLVPNHLSASWGADFIKAYPSAKILVGDAIESRKARKEFLYRARNGDFDAIVMKHSTFENMNVMQSFEEQVIEEQINNLKTQLEREKNPVNEKERKKFAEYLDKKLKSYEKKLETLAVGKKYDEEIAFEDLGIDCLMVDEAHYFKNLFITSTQENVKGIPTTESRKAMKMYCATQYIHQNNFKLYFLTGTPISNSIAEFYTMQRYLQPHILKELRLENFDDWQRAFTSISLNEELDSSGVNYTLVSRLSSFVNAPELMNFYKQNADVVTTEDIEKLSGRLVPKIKGGKAMNIIVPRSEAIANFIGIEDERGNYNQGSIIDRMNKRLDDPKKNNILVCTSEARKAALDFRLIDPYALDYEDSKINKMVHLVKEHYDDKRYEKNTQLIFCDLGVSKMKSQKIDLNADSNIETQSIEEIAKAKGLEFHTEFDEQGNEIKSYYREFERDDNGNFVYEEILDENGKTKKEKIVSKIYEIEELINEQGKFDVYAEILKKLVKAGIPQKEIAFIGDAKSDKEKQILFDKVNDGIVRILIGSTAKMGTGTNVQTRIVAMHELDCPWKPSELEQRAGRGIRQGNLFFEQDKENFEIAHYRYATEQTYDARMFQINEQKLKPLVQMKKAEDLSAMRVVKSIDEEMANIAEMKAIATGNPFILEKHKIKNLLESEENYKKYYERSIINAERDLDFLKFRKKELQNSLEALQQMFNNKGFSKENYELEVLGIKTNKKPKNKDDEKAYKIAREKIESKIIDMLRRTENYTEESKDGRRKIEFLKANDISVEFYSKEEDKKLYLNGVIVTNNDKRFKPANLSYVFDLHSLFKTEFNLNSFLTRIKNTFDKISQTLENTNKALKECEENIISKENFLQNNTIESYGRNFIIDILKQDMLHINEIFTIRQEKRQEGIKIDMQSKEIAHLLPQYTKYLNEKGKFVMNKEEQQEQTELEILTSKTLKENEEEMKVSNTQTTPDIDKNSQNENKETSLSQDLKQNELKSEFVQKNEINSTNLDEKNANSVQSLGKKDKNEDLEFKNVFFQKTNLNETQENLQENKGNQIPLQEKRKVLDNTTENLAKISQDEHSLKKPPTQNPLNEKNTPIKAKLKSNTINERDTNMQDIIPQIKISLKDFKEEYNATDKIKILEQNMRSIKREPHSKKILGRV